MSIREKEMGLGAILIVDDEELTLEVLSEMIEELEFDVFQASTGAKAIEIFKKHCENIALVVLDLVLPDIDCETLFLGLKKIDPNCKILLSTGFDKSEEVEKVMKLGCDGYIQKPCSMNDLEETIQSIIGR